MVNPHLTSPVLNSPFDLKTHVQTFINYLEVVIYPDGTIEYAVPSHREKMLLVCAEQITGRKWNYHSLEYQEMRERFTDATLGMRSVWHEFLLHQSGLVLVWNKGYQADAITPEQSAALKMLSNAGPYGGEVPEPRPSGFMGWVTLRPESSDVPTPEELKHALEKQ